MKRKLLSVLALLCLTVTSAWAAWDGGNYTATANERINGTINVGTATLTIPNGVTVTVNGSIVVSGTLTVTGSGTLEVIGSDGKGGTANTGENGAKGGDAIVGDVNIKGAIVNATGGDGGEGSIGIDGEEGSYGGVGGNGGNGGSAFTGGVVTVYSGEVVAYGGYGGDAGDGGWGDYGGKGGNGGNGGDAFKGTMIIYGGKVKAYGGNRGWYGGGGDGNVSGQDGIFGLNGYAFSFNSKVSFQTQIETMVGGDDPDNASEINTVFGKCYVKIEADDAIYMDVTANLASSAFWATFYNEDGNFIAPSGTQVFAVSLDDATATITLTEIADRIVKAGEGVVLKQATTSSNATATITMVKTSTAPNYDFENNDLGGTMTDISAPNNAYVLGNGANGVGFYKLASNGTIGANKAYLTYNGASTAREFFAFNEATAISTMQMTNNETNGEVFDMQGRRVAQPRKGLYIVNGKKVIIK